MIVAGLTAIVALPLATIVVLSLTAPDNAWPHLMRTVLPGALRDTAMLMLGVGLICLAFGTGAAWLITMYRFPGRAVLDRLLVLPLAMPTYIIAYCYVELLDFSGPVQRLLRAMFGWQTVRDYWFPEIRTLPGAIHRAVGRSLPLRLSVGAGELRAAVGMRAGGGAHAGPHLG